MNEREDEIQVKKLQNAKGFFFPSFFFLNLYFTKNLFLGMILHPRLRLPHLRHPLPLLIPNNFMLFF